MTPTLARTAPAILERINNLPRERIAQNIHNTTTVKTTRLGVRSSLYLRWRWMAKNLSALRAITPKNEADECKVPKSVYAVYTAQVELFSTLIRNQLNSNTTSNGWTRKPTPRSETARLMRSVFRVSGNDKVLLNACIVTTLKMIAVTDRKMFKTQLAINHEYKPSTSALKGCINKTSLQSGFFMSYLGWLYQVFVH